MLFGNDVWYPHLLLDLLVIALWEFRKMRHYFWTLVI